MSDAIFALCSVTAEDLLEPDSSDSEQTGSTVDSPPYSPFSLPSTSSADEDNAGDQRQEEENETVHIL